MDQCKHQRSIAISLKRLELQKNTELQTWAVLNGFREWQDSAWLRLKEEETRLLRELAELESEPQETEGECKHGVSKEKPTKCKQCFSRNIDILADALRESTESSEKCLCATPNWRDCDCELAKESLPDEIDCGCTSRGACSKHLKEMPCSIADYLFLKDKIEEMKKDMWLDLNVLKTHLYLERDRLKLQLDEAMKELRAEIYSKN